MITFFKTQALKLLGGASAALLIALGIVMWRADSLSNQRDDERAARVAEIAAHAITRASLASLQTKLNEFVQAGELRAESRDEALEEVEAEVAELRAQASDFDITTAEGL